MARLFDDGASEYLRRTSSPVSGYPYALVGWFYLDDLSPDYQVILSVGEVGGTKYAALRKNAEEELNAFLYDGNSRNCLSSTTINQDTWHHGCALYVASNDRRVFLDGGGKNTTAEASAAVALTATAVGVSADSTPFGYLSGRVAEAAVWDLSAWPGATASDKADEFERVAIPALALGYAPLFFALGLKAYWQLIRDEDQDRVGGYDLTAFNAPGIAAHPPIIYPAPPHMTYVSAGVPPPVGPFLTTYAGYSVPVG